VPSTLAEDSQLDAHQRVRTGVRYAIEPRLLPDVLGMYVYLSVIQ
jgi:hypothetical protein